MLTRREFLQRTGAWLLERLVGRGQREGDYPYISGIGEHVYGIYEVGQTFGNRPDVFAKVGDSITRDSRFLAPIGQGRYNLHEEYAYLEPVIEYFKDSFARESAAAAVGWRSAAVLSGKSTVKGVCGRGETPLSCEYRVNQPAIALIMLGTNDAASGIRPAAYETTMRQVIEQSEVGGTIPVLFTIPPMERRTAYPISRYNEVVRRLAAEQEVPLIDYWQALQSVAGYGLSSDGVHPWSTYAGAADFSEANLAWAGVTVRNLLTLMALDEISRYLGLVDG